MAADPDVPAPIAAAHEGWRFDLVYSYLCKTWKMTSPADEIRYVKVGRKGRYPSLGDERDRMVWAKGRLPVPRVIDFDSADETEWLLTAALPGLDATQPEIKADPTKIVPLLADGLRAFHATPIDDCPFDFRLDAALEHVRRRVAGEKGLPIDVAGFHAEHAHLSPDQALEILDNTRPASEDVVLCHGDYCFPNVFVEDGCVTGYLDLGEMGLADRWCDLAIGTWTCDWNVGPGWGPLFLESYGIEPDEERIRYYRLLYELAS